MTPTAGVHVEINGVTARNCRCCGKEVRIMCETDYCGQRCRSGKCGHPVAELAEVIARKQEEIRPIWDAMVDGNSRRT